MPSAFSFATWLLQRTAWVEAMADFERNSAIDGSLCSE